MLTADLINNNIPKLHLTDSVSKALQLMNDFRVFHLPVISEEKYLGLISEDDLLDAEDEKNMIETLQDHFIQKSLLLNEHFLNALNFSNKFESSVIPVTNTENELIGVITTPDLLKTLGAFSGATEIGGIIVVEMERIQFSISEISRIVESNDATILHLNTTVHPETGLLTVTLHLNKKEISAIMAAFERFEYDIIYSYGNDDNEHEIKGNYLHLMNYLDI
jgi:acetoin utilization protein AcuB